MNRLLFLLWPILCAAVLHAEAGKPREGYVPVPKDYASADGERIDIFYRYYAADPGKRRPTLLLFHGGPGAPNEFELRDRPFYSALLRDFDILEFHQRGAGKSHPLESEQDPLLPFVTLDNIVSDAEAVRRRVLGESTPVVAYGRSWGVVPAASFALRHPGNVSAVVLGNGRLQSLEKEGHPLARADYDVARFFASHFDRWAFPHFATYLENLLRKAPDPDQAREYLHAHYYRAKEIVAFYRQVKDFYEGKNQRILNEIRKFRAAEDGVPGYFNQVAQDWLDPITVRGGLDLLTPLSRLRKPVFLFTGNEDWWAPGYVIDTYARALTADGAPAERVVRVYPGSGHFTPDEHPARLAGDIRHFLATNLAASCADRFPLLLDRASRGR